MVRGSKSPHTQEADDRMTLKLLFVNSSLTDGGSEKAMALVAQAMAARGHEVVMALAREKPRTYPLNGSIKIVQFQYGKSGKARKAMSRLRQLRTLIRSHDFDYVVCYMWDLNIATLVASLGLRRRIIVSERSFPGASARSRLSRLVESLAYRLAYRIVYQTPDAQAFCPRGLLSRSVIVPNMIEIAALKPYIGTRSRRMVSIGRLGPQKNFPLLMRSFARFLDMHPGWSLEIYGKGATEGHLRALADRLRIAESVVFAGYVDDLHDQIRDAGMFVLASDYEGISNAMAESMALGLPVISTDCPVGGAALLIKDGESGRLVPVRDETALTQAMSEIASDENLSGQISRGARISAERFSPDRLALTWERDVLC